MHQCNYRKNGGLGFAVSTNKHYIQARIGEENSIEAHEKVNDDGKIKYLERLLDKIHAELKLNYKVKIKIFGVMYFHSGLGCGTSLTLACVESLLAINNFDYSEDFLIQLSERGGTSGIGINSYFKGGLIYDLGVKSQDYKTHLPSSFVDNPTRPTPLYIGSMPEWEIGFVIPRSGRSTSSYQEKNLFERICPIEDARAFQACYLSVFGTLSSLIERDYKLFAKSINETALTTWKSLEISEAGLNQEIEQFRSFSTDCFGMSSIGPGIYFFCEKPDEIGLSYENKGYGKYISMKICNNGRCVSWN